MLHNMRIVCIFVYHFKQSEVVQVMQVTALTIDIYTPRILPVGASPTSGIFDIKYRFEAGGQRYYTVAISPTLLFQATEVLTTLADEYEASQVVLEDDFSAL